MLLGYLGIDQYGERYKIDKHPRKELLEKFATTHAEKMYVDTLSGIARHIGYIIRKHWITVYEVHSWKN